MVRHQHQLTAGYQRGAGARRVDAIPGRGVRRGQLRGTGGRGSAGATRTAWGGVLASRRACTCKFPGRVLDTPRSSGRRSRGSAIGAATCVPPPVSEPGVHRLQGRLLRPIFNRGQSCRYMFGARRVTPVVIRTMWARARARPRSHSQVRAAVGGSRTSSPAEGAAPSNLRPAKGLLIRSIRTDDP